MRKQLKFAIFFALFSEAAYAQQLSVRSGDHPTFSRLTIPVPEAQKWEARQTETGVELRLRGFTEGFDTSGVFQRMKSDRINGLASRGSVLDIQIQCDCIASAFRAGPLLVIDVADRGTALPGPQIQFSAPVSPSKQAQIQPTSLPWIGSASPFPHPNADHPQVDPVSVSTTAGQRTKFLNETQQNLAAEIADAASIGLLENNLQIPAPAVPRTPPLTATLEAKELPKVLQTPAGNIRVTNSMELPSGASSRTVNATMAGMSCPADSFLAIHDWAEDTPFSAQIGPARQALMNARDQLEVSAAKHLVQLYLYFGFGAEALSVLKLDPDIGRKLPELSAVAHILEGRPLKGPNALTGFTDCGSDVALWSSLSLEEIPTGLLIDIDAVLLALNKLPEHLRRILAPTLSKKLLSYGDSEASAAAMRSIERLPEPLNHEAIMAQAAMAIDAGKPADGLLEEVIKTNSTQAPDALIKLVEGKLSRDETLSYETATLVEAYAQELRGTELGSKLRQTQVIALSQSQHFREAFEALDVLRPSISPEVHSTLLKAILKQLSDKADDLAFLEFVFVQNQEDIRLLGKKTQLLLAARTMDLGFAAQVQEMLNEVPERPRSKERQLLAARAALGLRQPFQAQAALIGIDGPVAALLLAQAKEMAGSYREASLLFSENNADQQAAQAAWLADEWRDLTPAETPEFGAVAALSRESSPEGDLGPLGLADQALSESAAARNTLEQLLNSRTITPVIE